MTQLYRIHTEDIQQDAIRAILDASFAAYTVLPANGVWQGTREDALVIEVYASADALPVIKTIAEQIRTANKQSAVLVASFPVTTHLLTGD